MELIENGIRVELEAIGEGLAGDYEPEDPHDVELLRFYVSVHRDLLRDNPLSHDCAWGTLHGSFDYDEINEWVEVDKASYCTLLPVSITEKQQGKALRIIMNNVRHAILNGHSVSGKAKPLADMDEDWVA